METSSASPSGSSSCPSSSSCSSSSSYSSSSSSHASHGVSTIYEGKVSSKLGMVLKFKVKIVSTCNGGAISSRTFSDPVATIAEPIPCERTHTSPEGVITRLKVDSVSAEKLGDTLVDPLSGIVSQRVRVTWSGRSWDPENPAYCGTPLPFTIVSDKITGVQPYATLACEL